MALINAGRFYDQVRLRATKTGVMAKTPGIA
jgi:hypothetical protein